MIPGVESPLPASLFIVATPIGNLDDMSMRAIDVLRSVALIAAEDTRHSAKLLRHFDIRTPLISYHDHSDTSDLHGMLKRLRTGETIALISDAGTPLVSDPGYKLVEACHREPTRGAHGDPRDSHIFRIAAPPCRVAGGHA